LSSKGQKQTPKSLLLGILIRQLTGSAEVINVLNYFGHCASCDTVIRHETALATIQSNNQSFVTRDMVKNQPTVLGFDNQDYNEETKQRVERVKHISPLVLLCKGNNRIPIKESQNKILAKEKEA
jgi:hypothetical protein